MWCGVVCGEWGWSGAGAGVELAGELVGAMHKVPSKPSLLFEILVRSGDWLVEWVAYGGGNWWGGGAHGWHGWHGWIRQGLSM